VHVLPAGSGRDRYRQEFLAELHDLTVRRRISYVIGVASQLPVLRAALRSSTRSSWEAIVGPRPRRPWPCALNLRHRWYLEHTEDGHRYLACARCGKEHASSGSHWGASAGGL
jgi:hypothetical protein